ncbi:MAG: bifunctional phosphopantothenoylcysteine decarboxylase/phosphopantothenate--cysteine ligase CoaBC [Bacteroidales bacterium]|jgi:phosphopantothenoylcysteine decarboxylase/phosphopantothenate--cysteine ligase|nr:bifunctional phosphopantothenoylcysteine decarboxylase/phosphopantothenate--cysteine ligase CoaBC [Bacteroidales bacterium]
MYNKKILVGISGGISAYKTLILIRLMVKNGCEVKTVVSKNAFQFVTPLSLETLSGNDVYSDMFAANRHLTTEHISLAQWADCVIVAPATADIIASLANGIADDALSTTLLAFEKIVFIAPAMNKGMYAHPAVKKNLQTLQSYGYQIIEPQTGELACHTEGKGRMEEPEKIWEFVQNYFKKEQKPSKKALVTAGPTYEPIDAVRFIGNYSSGKMGFAIAEELAKNGFEVDLVTGHTALKTLSPNIKRHDVQTAEEMLNKCVQLSDKQDVIVMSAAVADFTPQTVFDGKIKKSEQAMTLQLKPTKDILKTISLQKKDNQVLVGFALEKNNEIDNAIQKLYTKNLDFIVLNSLNDEGAGFDVPTNKITLINRQGEIQHFGLKSKEEAATDIVKYILKLKS